MELFHTHIRVEVDYGVVSAESKRSVAGVDGTVNQAASLVANLGAKDRRPRARSAGDTVWLQNA